MGGRTAGSCSSVLAAVSGAGRRHRRSGRAPSVKMKQGAHQKVSFRWEMARNASK